jgi:hypothetical protein
LNIEKIAVLTPSPSDREAMATAVTSGRCLSDRTA